MSPTKKKPSLSAMLGMGSSESEPDEAEGDAGGKSEAAAQILEALKTSDAEALSTALSAFMDLHEAEEDDEEGEGEEDEAHEEDGEL